LKLELTLTDNMIRDRIRRIRIAYGRDPNCIACGPKVKEQLDILYGGDTAGYSCYHDYTLYGIPILISQVMYTDDLLFLMDIDNLLATDELEALSGLPELLI